MSEPSTIHVRRLANVDYVTLNRPEVRNAFNEQLIAEMTTWAERAAADSSTARRRHQRRRAVFLRGRRPGVDGEDGGLHAGGEPARRAGGRRDVCSHRHAADAGHRADSRRRTGRRRRARRGRRHRRGRRRHDVRLHRSEAGLDPGGDCALRAGEDRSVRCARAVRDRPPLRRCACAETSASSTLSCPPRI